MKANLIAGIAVVLAACSSEPSQTAMFHVNSADFSTASNENLCSVYGFRANRSVEARAELTRRGVFTLAEWQNIDAHNVLPGMSECAVSAAYFVNVAKVEGFSDPSGKPVRRTLVYACDKSPVPSCPYTQVVLQRGVVVSVSPRSAL
jgi:hypothetical protein